MQLVERTFRLEADTGLGATPKPELIGPVFSRLHDTLQDAVRMGFLHSSRARAGVSRSIRRAAEVRFVGHTAGDDEHVTNLRFVVPQFGDVAADLFEQHQLWDDGPRADETAFELLGKALADVQHRRVESNRFDPMLLQRFSGYRRMFGKRGLSRIVLVDTDTTDDQTTASPHIDSEVVGMAHALSEATPAPRRVRVSGRLDLMGVSQGILKIELEPGTMVTARWEGREAVQTLKSLFDRKVVCEGVGIFRPSGALLRIDADAIERATGSDAAFAQLPLAVATPERIKPVRARVGEPSPYAAFIGSVPAEESDEEFAAAVEAMS